MPYELFLFFAVSGSIFWTAICIAAVAMMFKGMAHLMGLFADKTDN